MTTISPSTRSDVHPRTAVPSPASSSTRTGILSSADMPAAAGGVSAAIRALITQPRDLPPIISGLIGQIERAIGASPDVSTDADLRTALELLDGVAESRWAGVDVRWSEDDELHEARTVLRAELAG